jgi:hypothetical protein
LHRYTTEFSFRWNHRQVSDGQRMVAAIKGAEGKRLMVSAAKARNAALSNSCALSN